MKPQHSAQRYRLMLSIMLALFFGGFIVGCSHNLFLNESDNEGYTAIGVFTFEKNVVNSHGHTNGNSKGKILQLDLEEKTIMSPVLLKMYV
jgi:hypothetical protein